MTPEQYFIAGVIFQAGILYAVIRYLRRDVNGIGKKLRKVIAAIILFVPESEREKIVRMLLTD